MSPPSALKDAEEGEHEHYLGGGIHMQRKKVKITPLAREASFQQDITKFVRIRMEMSHGQAFLLES